MSGQCHSGGLSRKTNKTNPLLTSSREYVEQNANVSQFPGQGAIKWLEDTPVIPAEVLQDEERRLAISSHIMSRLQFF